MSTKKLQHSVIEGGRTRYNKWERRNSHNSVRNSERHFCHRVELDIESADDFVIVKKDHLKKDFSDKLGPMYRWLHSQVGRLWNDVRSEISQKFDDRTTAGRHILYDHLLSAVEEVPDLDYSSYRNPYNYDDFTTSHYYNSFYVDENNLLQRKTYIPINRNKIPKFNTASIANWLNGHVIGKIGNKLFWFTPTTKNAKRGGSNHEWKTEWTDKYYNKYGYNGLIFLYSNQEIIYIKNKEGIMEKVGSKLTWVATTPNFRQDRKLNDKEIVFWNSMPIWYQNKILERSPTYPTNLKPSYKNPFYYWAN